MPPDAVKVEGQLTFFPYPRTVSAFPRFRVSAFPRFRVSAFPRFRVSAFPRVERDGFETFHHDGDGCEYVSDFFGG